MKQLLDRYRNTPLRRRLVVPVAAALLASLLICQWLLFAFTQETLNRQLQHTAQTSALQVRDYADQRLRSVVESMYYFRLMDSVEENLTNYLLDDGSEAVIMSSLYRDLSFYRATEPLIASLFLYTPKGLITGVGVPVEPDFRFEDSVFQDLLQENSDQVLFGPAHQDPVFISHRWVAPILYRFTIAGSGGECVLVANLDLTKLESALQELLPEDGSQFLLLDAGGIPVTQASTPAQQAFLEAGPASAGPEGYLAEDSHLETAPWRLVFLQATQVTVSILERLQLFSLAIILLVTVLALVTISRIVNTIIQPLTRLCGHIRTNDANGAAEAFDYPYGDEFGTLTAAYNRMIRHIHSLLLEQQDYIRRLEEEKARADIEQAKKRRAELTALQAQINPHFLYNTLDSIHWKAEKAGADDISQMTMALATLFRVSLSRGAEIIPVASELSHVESYLKIQNQRYRDRLSYTLDIPPEVLTLHTVKLILQPLVENAIYHGIKESEHNGVVHISCRRNGDVLEMRVSDNGLGIQPQRLEKLQADLARGYSVDRDGYGIFNVNARIRLYFGPEYGLTLESKWGEGTVSLVRLPIIEQEDVDKYVSDHDR